MSKAAFTISTLAAAALSACVAVGGDPPGDALAEVTTKCQQQELAPEFDMIRTRVSTSVVGATPAPFMLASTYFPSPGERMAIARWSQIRDTCSQRTLALINVPPSGFSQPLWQQVAQILRQDADNQHALMATLANGQMPYGQFVEAQTQIAVRRQAALQPFYQEAAALDQIAGENAEAVGATVDFLIDLLDAASDAGAFQGGHHRSGGAHRDRHASAARYR
jgi:hypothetical protein